MSARFYPPKGGLMAMAVIDPGKVQGEEGQYVKHEGVLSSLMCLAYEAKEQGKEVRFYYQGLIADGEEPVASKVIETWIPAGHVQPFHTHHTVHEMTLVMEGAILTVDSDTLSEDALKELVGTDALLTHGDVVGEHEMIIEGPGTRHTIVNHTDGYAVLVTVQTARMDIDKFSSDWHRDKPVA